MSRRLRRQSSTRTTTEFAPRLAHGCRIKTGVRRDPLVHAGLKAIASAERKSVNWVVEEVLIDYFRLRHSRYRERRNGR